MARKYDEAAVYVYAFLDGVFHWGVAIVDCEENAQWQASEMVELRRKESLRIHGEPNLRQILNNLSDEIVKELLEGQALLGSYEVSGYTQVSVIWPDFDLPRERPNMRRDINLPPKPNPEAMTAPGRPTLPQGELRRRNVYGT